MLKRLIFCALFVFPIFLFSQYESWLDERRYRLSHGYGDFMQRNLWQTHLYGEYWQPLEPKDLQWGLGMRLMYAERLSPGSPQNRYRYRIGDRDYDQSLVLGFYSTVGMTVFYTHAKEPNFSGRFRLEVPVGLDAIIGGGEKLIDRVEAMENGVSIEREFWHKENLILWRPSLGLGVAYNHSLDHNWGFGFYTGFTATLEMDLYLRAGIILEYREVR
jgi:hypothetical protein